MKANINLEKRLRLSVLFAIITITAIIWTVLFVQGRALKRGASEDAFSRVENLIRIELSQMAAPIEQQLTQLRYWGKLGIFHEVDTLDYPEFFKPILTNTPLVDGLFIVKSDGAMLSIQNIDDSISVRFSHPINESTTEFDPRQRPWYLSAIDSVNAESICWSSPYIFHTKKQPGITASTAWITPSGEQIVVAVDILLTSISSLVRTTTVGNGGQIFLINKQFELFDVNDDESISEVSNERTLFTRWESIEDPIMRDILDRNFKEEREVAEDLYYVRTSNGNYWVQITRLQNILSKYALLIAAPEKGLNARLEQMTLFLNIVSAIIVLLGGILLFIILYHSLYALRLINNVGELNNIFSDSRDINTFLDNTVTVIARFMRVPVCSIYLFNERRNMLILKGTHGLNKEKIDKIELGYGEGLVGLTLKQLHSLRVTGASGNKDFRPFEDLNEEQYDSFLAVPITRGLHKIGVLVVQKKLKGSFSNRAVETLEIIASQLTSVMETAGFLLTIFNGESSEEEDLDIGKISIPSVKGKVASPGYAVGSVTIDHKRDIFTILKRVQWGSHYSLSDFELAVKSTAHDLEKLQLSVEERLEDNAAMIFVAHLLMLKDDSFTGAITRHIKNGITPPEAVLHVAEELMRSFAMSTSKMIQEKVDDVKDLTVRLLSHLSPDLNRRQNHKDRIVIARELYPSDILIMASEKVKAIILVSGGATSHLAILCRSLQIPLLLTTDSDILSISPDSVILLDANHGIAYVDPTEEQLNTFRPLLASNITLAKSGIKDVKTADGQKVSLHANVNLITDISQAKHLHIEGIGLYRSEFPFMIRDSFPTEGEQYTIYKKVADHVHHREMTFRTLDIGGDKALSYHDGLEEENPFLGLRAIRFSLKEKDIFVHQVKAILRAAVHTDLRIMFPMIQSVDEFKEARQIVKETIENLQSNGIICHPSPQIGMMVELPAAVTLIEQFAQVSDFFSIGSNDLIQYLLGVDRTNSEVAPLYKPHHPAVLSAIAQVAKTAQKYDKDVSVCGDMAGSADYIPFLLGCGITKLSVDPVYIPRVQECIKRTSIAEAKALAASLLDCSTIAETAKIIRQEP